MEATQLIAAIAIEANNIKKQLTASYFSGDKSFFNQTLAQYPFCKKQGLSVYETINNLAAKVAQSKEY
jgi:hypothetical protein